MTASLKLMLTKMVLPHFSLIIASAPVALVLESPIPGTWGEQTQSGLNRGPVFHCPVTAKWRLVPAGPFVREGGGDIPGSLLGGHSGPINRAL